MITSHAVTMLLLHQCIIYTHFVCVFDGKTRVSGLWREKKIHDVSEPYLMQGCIISAQKLPSTEPIAAATLNPRRANDAIRAYFAWHSTFGGLKAASFGRIYVILHLLCCGVCPGLTVWRRFVHIRFHSVKSPFSIPLSNRSIF
jgi:hypothetical protein